MDFLAIGSLSSYVKSLEMQNKWSMKKASGDFTPKESHKNKYEIMNEAFKKSYYATKEDDKNDETLKAIQNKINQGSKLTLSEMRYLQSKDPVLYQKLRNLEHEKKSYEKELKRCKTKDDVERLKTSKVCESLSAINAVKNNPNIPQSVKLGIAAEECRRLSELNKVSAKFEKSESYHRLPTEAELRKAEHDVKKAEENERINAGKVEKAEENSKTEETKNDEDAEECESAESEADKDMTRIKAENTPEARKAKQSKVKAVYTRAFESDAAIDFNPVLNNKA